MTCNCCLKDEPSVENYDFKSAGMRGTTYLCRKCALRILSVAKAMAVKPVYLCCKCGWATYKLACPKCHHVICDDCKVRARKAG